MSMSCAALFAVASFLPSMALRRCHQPFRPALRHAATAAPSTRQNAQLGAERTLRVQHRSINRTWSLTRTQRFYMQAAAAEPAEGTMEVDIKVSGMVCGGCSERVEKALKQSDGVSAVEVNLESGIATVLVAVEDQLDAATTALPRLVETVESLGFEAEPYFG